MRMLIIDFYYPAFINSLYVEHPALARQPYEVQWRVVMDQCFGTADFYSRNLQHYGVEATEVVANCMQLQRNWCEGNGITHIPKRWLQNKRSRWVNIFQRPAAWIAPTLFEQIRNYHPDILYIQDMVNVPAKLLREVRPFTGCIVGQIACKIPPTADFREYDLVLSSLPHYVRQFQKKGLRSALFRLGFEVSILNRLQPSEHSIPVCHIGGYGPIHHPRNRLLEALLERGIRMSCWGYGIERLPSSSPIHKAYKGEAWGMDMYRRRHQSRIVVSMHIPEVAGEYANIMTLYEATGVGSMLLIDRRQDLDQLFSPGKEVVDYRDAQECAELVTHFLDHEDQRNAIATAGQRRTLAEHTYKNRMSELVELIRPLVE